MASPFKVFRKHQKAMLAVLTIVAMFSFVFLGVISELLGTRAPQNPVVVKTSQYGNLKASDLGTMRSEHLKVLSILAKIHAESVGLKDPQFSYKQMESLFGTASDEDLVNAWIKEQRAEEIGMVISNNTINEFLQTVSAGKLASNDIALIIKQEGLTQNQFFDALRMELKAFELTQLFSVGLQGVTPAQRWDYFCQLRKEATIEAIPVEAEQFLAQIKDPSEAEIKTLFEKYKDKLPRPDSPEPGFRVPHKIDVQYFKADVAKFSDPSTITDEEIQNTYEKNRKYFDQFDKQPDISLMPGGKKATEKDKAPDVDKTDVNKTDADKKETAPAADQPKEQPKEQPATDEKAPEQKTSEQPDTDKKLPEQKPADQPAKGQENAPKEETPKASAVERSPFMLTAMADDAAKTETTEPPKTETTEQPKTETATETPAAQADKAVSNMDEPKKDEVKSEESKAEESAKPAATDSTQETPESPKRELTEKVKEKVRAMIAQQKSYAVLTKLQQTVEENGKEWRKYEAEKINKKTATPPAKLDLEALAKENNLTAGQTGVVSAWNIQKFDIGTSSSLQTGAPFALTAFQSMAAYKTDISIDTTGNLYLFWKVNDLPEAAPSLDDKTVRDEVIHAWKMIEARKLALKKAEELAKSARDSGSTLKNAFSGVPSIKVLTPAPFTMLTEGNVPRASSRNALRYSDVEGVFMPGQTFMRTVFNLEKGKIGVAMNAPETTAYVIQIEDFNPSHEVLWKIFQTEDISKYSAAAMNEIAADRNAWLESLKTYAGLKWEKSEQQQRSSEPTPDSLPDEL